MNQPDALSAALVEAWRSGKALDADTAIRLAPRDDATAYSVQRQVAHSLGWFPSGRPRAWKMGAPSLGAQPTAAGIADQLIVRGTPESPFRLSLSSVHTLIGVEVELTIKLAHDLGAHASFAEASAAVGEVYAAIEVCDVRAEAWKSLPPLFRLADQQMNRWLILGTSTVTPWQQDYAQREVVLDINDHQAARHNGGHPLDEPLHLLPWLANHVASQYEGGLQAGDLITTGTWTGLYEAKAGDRIHASFGGIGEVALVIHAA